MRIHNHKPHNRRNRKRNHIHIHMHNHNPHNKHNRIHIRSRNSPVTAATPRRPQTR